MPKASTSGAALQKIANALDAFKHINKYQKESREKVPALLRRKRKAKAPTRQYIRVVQPELFNTEPTFDVIITALKEKIRKEVMSELMNSLTKA